MCSNRQWAGWRILVRTVCFAIAVAAMPGSGVLIVPNGTHVHGAHAPAQRYLGRVVHVDLQNPAAADGNPGTNAMPVKTIGRATRLAVIENVKGNPVTILIHPGTYRETIFLPPGGTDAPVTFQATEVRKVVVSGSDIWKGWTRRGTGGGYARAWPFTWGLSPVPQGWPALRPIVRHREMVFVNGNLLTQVLTPDQLVQGTFCVDEEAHQVYIWPAAGIDPNSATVEVAVRDPLFKAEGRVNLTIRGLVFEHAATGPDASAVTVDAMRGFLIEDTTFRWNNWGGLGITGSSNGIIRRSAANHNGARGMSNWKNLNLLYEDTETSYNNWRGAWGSYYGWSNAGIKNLLLHGGVFHRHKSVGNATYGFWLDTDNRDITVDGGFWCGNIDGAFVEMSQGPIVIARTIICKNASTGLIASLSGRVTVRDSILYENGTEAQYGTNDLVSDTVVDWETGRGITVRTEYWTFCGNAFVGTQPSQHLVSVPSWDFFRNTLQSSQNVYWNPVRPDAFWVRGSSIAGHSLGGRSLDLPGWQRAWGQDSGSVFADPRFTDADHWNFAPLPDSPWRKCR